MVYPYNGIPLNSNRELSTKFNRMNLKSIVQNEKKKAYTNAFVRFMPLTRSSGKYKSYIARCRGAVKLHIYFSLSHLTQSLALLTSIVPVNSASPAVSELLLKDIKCFFEGHLIQ